MIGGTFFAKKVPPNPLKKAHNGKNLYFFILKFFEGVWGNFFSEKSFPKDFYSIETFRHQNLNNLMNNPPCTVRAWKPRRRGEEVKYQSEKGTRSGVSQRKSHMASTVRSK